jgi:hypothetical protein
VSTFPFYDFYIALIHYVCIQAEVIQNHEKKHIRGLRQGEARHRKYKRLKLGGGQAYDRSND